MNPFQITLPPWDSLYYSVAAIIALAILLLFVVEILAKLNNTPNDNVNTIIREWAYTKFYFITFFFGIVAGHLFLGSETRWIDCSKYGISMSCEIFDVLVIAGLTIILIITGVLFQKKRTSPSFQLILFGAGLLVGHFVWSMNDFAPIP